MKLAAVVFAWRMSNGLTLKQVSAEIGIPLPTYHRFEQGKPFDGRTMAALLAWLIREEK